MASDIITNDLSGPAALVLLTRSGAHQLQGSIAPLKQTVWGGRFLALFVACTFKAEAAQGQLGARS